MRQKFPPLHESIGELQAQLCEAVGLLEEATHRLDSREVTFLEQIDMFIAALPEQYKGG